MINKVLTTITFLSLIASSYGQSIRNEYYPLDPSLKSTYYIDNFGDTVHFILHPTQKNLKEHLYFIEQEYKINTLGEMLTHEYYYRLDSGNVYVTQNGQKLESLFLPFKPIIGQTWYLSDKGWQWKVISIDATFSTSVEIYPDLLKIQEFDLEIPEDTAIYFSYFKKGLGLVARTRNGVVERLYIGRK